MQKWKYLVSTAVLGASMTLGATDADAARRQSLAENKLIEDKDDIFIFPQLVTQYNNLVSFEMGSGFTDGNGLLLFGSDQMAYGIAIHRGDVLDRNFFPYDLSLNELSNLNAPIDGFPAPNTIIDGFFGMDMGGALVGGRLSLGTGGSSTFTPGEDEDDEQGQSLTFVRLDVGYSMMGDLRIDTGLRIGFDTASQYVTEGDTASGTQFGIAADLRGYTPFAEGVDLGFLAEIGFATTSTTAHGDPEDDEDDVSSSSSVLALNLGAGPVFQVADQAIIGAYGVLGVARESEDPDVDEDFDSSSSMTFLLPGLHLAADIALTDWLYFRSGMQYTFALGSQSTEQEDLDDIVQSARASDFAWRAGLGLEVGNFAFDGALQSGFLVNGPNFIGGGSGLFTMVNAKYTF